jgi:hypothetical protein
MKAEAAQLIEELCAKSSPKYLANLSCFGHAAANPLRVSMAT